MANVITMPKLSDTMTVGTLVKWLKKEGDAVKAGDVIAEVETDKATMELDVLQSGVVLKLFAAEGAQLAIGAPIYAVGKAGEAVPEAPAAAPAAPAAAAPAPAAAAPAPVSVPAPAAAAPAAAPAAPALVAAPGERLKVSPLAKRIAQQLGVDLNTVAGTGPGGRIVRADVEAAAKAPKPAPAAPVAAAPAAPKAVAAGAAAPAKAAAPVVPFVGTAAEPVQEEKLVQVSTMRGTIARRLLESKTTIPHFYLELEIDAEPMVNLRAQLNQTFGESLKISLNDMILKGCAHALRKVPAVNASWENTAVHYHAAAHVSFAVAIEDGLITPVVRDTHAKTLFQISTEARSLAKLAREKKLKPEQFTGGTFCVSNLGMMGIEKFFAIINPPNAAILAVGATVKKPVVNAKGEIVVGQRLTLGLSVDHRVVDGSVGAAFLTALKEVLEKPLTLLA